MIFMLLADILASFKQIKNFGINFASKYPIYFTVVYTIYMYISMYDEN